MIWSIIKIKQIGTTNLQLEIKKPAGGSLEHSGQTVGLLGPFFDSGPGPRTFRLIPTIVLDKLENVRADFGNPLGSRWFCELLEFLLFHSDFE